MEGDTTSSDFEWTELKICTYNVHMWKDAKWDPNIDRVIDLVLEQKPHILCLQEATGSKELLRIKTECDFAKVHKFNGLAVLTKMPSNLLISYGDSPPNGFLLCQIEFGSGPPLLVVNLHPDCADEDTRLWEFRTWEEKAREMLSKDDNPQLWLGDFNALTREDYTQRQWDKIASERSKNFWEDPRTELMSLLGAKGLTDSWASLGRPGNVSTCRFGTHIDYILMNQAFEQDWRCLSVNHLTSDASDHSMVAAIYQRK